jgi:kynurenine formamidase
LAHVSHDGRLFGGYSAEAAQRGGFFNVLGVETIEPLLCRGILLDVAAARRQQQLAPGYGVTREDLIETAALEKVDVQSRDVVLVRTGWASLWADPAAYLGQVSGVPGLTVEGAAWLAERGVRATGSDTTAYERIPPGVGHHLLPVHGLLLVEHGIHIIEHLNLEELSHVGVWEFLFVLVPLKLVGATGSPVRPLALVTI